MARVLAVNGSPNADKGKTEKILAPFLDGMKDAGASVSKFYTKQLVIRPCTGEFICWNKRPGECHIQDDMQLLYRSLHKTDILVLATPVYIPLPGEMQNFLNRLLPLIDPYLSFKKGRTRAVFRPDVSIKKIALVATSGWWEMGNFGTVLRISRELAADVNTRFAGALLRPHAYEMAENPEKSKEIIEACHKAGLELIKEGKIARSTLSVISQPLISEEEYRRSNNDDWERINRQR